jgi:putative spermidine/putrescine transport system substrate-binding protein
MTGTSDTKNTGRSKISRRTFINTGTAAGATVLAAPFVSNKARAKSKTLYINTWGGSWGKAEAKAYYKPFEKATGITVKPVTPFSLAKFKAQVRSGNYQFSVAGMGRASSIGALKENLLEHIHYDIIDLTELPPDSVGFNGISRHSLSTNLVYNKKKFPNGGPQSWADFWDVEKFPGTRGGYKDGARMLAFALLADGVDKDKLYPLDVERGFKSLDRIKPHIKIWWRRGSQSVQLVRDGEVDMMPMWNTRAGVAIEQGVPIDIVWNQGHIRRSNWVVPRGAPATREGWEFAKFCLQAEPMGNFCNMMNTGPWNPAAYEFIPEKKARMMPTWKDNLPLCYQPDPLWVGTNLSQLTKRFNQWLAT